MKIIQVEWRSARDTVGFVLIQNDFGAYSVRIGPAKTKFDPIYDANYIAENGAKLTFDEAKGFFPSLRKTEYKK